MRAASIALLFWLSLANGGVQPETAGLAQRELFAAHYDLAADIYGKLLQEDPAWAPGYYGRMRALIGAYRASEAYTAAAEGLKRVPETAEAQTAAGLAAYRAGDLPKAEACFRKASKIEPKYGPAILGLIPIYRALSKYKSSRALALAAYRDAPADPLAIAEWSRVLQSDERMAALQRALAMYDPESRESQALRVMISRLGGAGGHPLRHLACPYRDYRLKLIRTPLGVALHVKLNQSRTVDLMLDTGSSGISIAPKAAEKAGLDILSGESREAHGIGKEKPQEAYDYLAKEVSIGDLDTSVNGGPLQFFLVDTGSTANLIDTGVAKESTKLHSDYQTVLRGIQGRADEVSRASKVSLVFAGYRQENSDALATSLEAVSDRYGVRIAGILGMPALGLMKLSFDYRNGAVRFERKVK